MLADARRDKNAGVHVAFFVNLFRCQPKRTSDAQNADCDSHDTRPENPPKFAKYLADPKGQGGMVVKIGSMGLVSFVFVL